MIIGPATTARSGASEVVKISVGAARSTTPATPFAAISLAAGRYSRCTWLSMNPGATHLPAASITFSPASGVSAPTATIVPSTTRTSAAPSPTTVPPSISSEPATICAMTTM